MIDDLVERLRDWPYQGETMALQAAAEITRLRARVEALEKRDSEAATHVESVIAMRTGFTGEMPYVGWKGLGLALNEALDARDAAEAQVAALTAQLATAREDAYEQAAQVVDARKSIIEVGTELSSRIRALKDAKP
jgi:hypothetical protein